ncbi:hypothetical protein D3C85_1454420 [compost metagenome]
MIDHPLSNLLYVELGLKPGSCVPLNERTKEFSLESMLLFETDYLLIDKRLAEYEDTAWNAGVLNGTSWEAMQAGKSTRTRVISNWIRMSWAPTGQHQIIDELLNLG